MFNNQGNSKPEAYQKENGDMALASEWEELEELVELDDVQLATIVGGWTFRAQGYEFFWDIIFGRQGYIWDVRGKFNYGEWKDWF